MKISGDPNQWLRRNLQLAATGDLTTAEKDLRVFLKEYPEHVPAHIQFAQLLLMRGRPEEGVSTLEILLAKPTPLGNLELEATLLLAECQFRTGQLAAAEAYGRRALALAPQDSRTSFAVAMVCQQTGRLSEALNHLQEGLLTQPDATHAWVNKGLIEKQMGRLNHAIASFEQALALNPAIAPAHYSLGLIHLMQGTRAKAEYSFRKALDIDPRHTHASTQLATLLRYENRLDEATNIYRTILQHTPDNLMARFYIEALQQPEGPARIPPNVVQAIFADEAVGRNLENSLKNHLNYQTPNILYAALQDIHGIEQQALDVLDLGCGSGLYGALIRSRAKELVGVDLSAAMIEECRHKNIYDELHIKDIEEYLSGTPKRFDLIIAMDVLCYFGDLRPLIYHCASILKPGGILACSVERAADENQWLFHRYGHFLHSAAHLRDAAIAIGMREIRMTECALRHELGEDRIGFVALFSYIKGHNVRPS